MSRSTDKQTYLRIPSDLLNRIDAFRHKQLIRPTLSDTIVALIERGLVEMEKESGTNAYHQPRPGSFGEANSLL